MVRAVEIGWHPPGGWTGQEQCRRHDGTVGEANGDGRPGEAVAGEGDLDEIRQDRQDWRCQPRLWSGLGNDGDVMAVQQERSLPG